MITIFACPKPFADPHIRRIQSNAIASWRALGSTIEILLFGEDPEGAEIAAQIDARTLPIPSLNEFGTPMMGGLLSKAASEASHSILCYVNADIIFGQDLLAAISRVMIWSANRPFLLTGGRTDFDVNELPSSDSDPWVDAPRLLATAKGPPLRSGVDYWVFPKGAIADLPNLGVGRPGVDNWLIWHCRSKRIPVIDATSNVLALHQTHRAPGEWAELAVSPEAVVYSAKLGRWKRSFTLDDASHHLRGDAVSSSRIRAAVHRVSVAARFANQDARKTIRALHRNNGNN
jgi:hypothetical protein